MRPAGARKVAERILASGFPDFPSKPRHVHPDELLTVEELACTRAVARQHVALPSSAELATTMTSISPSRPASPDFVQTHV